VALPGPQPAAPGEARVRAEGLSKTFGSARVLKDVDLEIRGGEIHALVGANGSGKSTLVKCVTGVERPDPGSRLLIDGREVLGHYSTGIAHDIGVRVVHQEAPLIDGLTLAETVGHNNGFPTRFGMIRRRRLEETTREMFKPLGVDIPPGTRAGSLSPPERAMVMLALALGSGEGKAIVLDEPTASLTSGDAERFLLAVRNAAGHDAAVLLVTHRLNEVFEICDRVTVLRDGERVLQEATSEVDTERLIDEIVGPDVDREAVRAARVPERFLPAELASEAASAAGNSDRAARRDVLVAKGLTGEAIENVSLAVSGGEIVGISGLLGSGASEVCRLLAGVIPPESGTVTVGETTLPAGFGVRDAMAAGISLVPGDRLREGGIANLSLLENMTLPNLPSYGHNRSRQRSDFEQVVGVLDVKPPEPRRPFGTLSGGNQQKLIVGKWALMQPRVFVLDDPTVGVDPGAREEILALLHGLADAGTALVVHSTEPEDLARLAHRVLIVREGRIASELRGEEVTERAITAAN